MNLGNSGRWVEPEAGFLEIKIQAAVKRKKSPILQVEIHTLVLRFFPKSRTKLPTYSSLVSFSTDFRRFFTCEIPKVNM